MKIELPTKTFQEALARVSHVPGSKGGVPETQLVKIVADFGGLTLTRVSPDALVVTQCDADVHDEGEVLLDFSKALNFATRTHAVKVLIESQPKEVHLKAGKAFLKVAAVDAVFAEPEKEDFDEEDLFELQVTELSRWIKVVEGAMAEASLSRPALEGMILQSIDETLHIIGTDGRRVHIIETDIEVPESFNELLPREVVLAIKAALAGEEMEAPVSLGIGERSILFRTHRIELRASKFEVTPPRSIAQLLKNDKVEMRMVVSPEEMIDAVRAAGHFGADEIKAVSLYSRKDFAEIGGNTGKGAEYRREVEIKGATTFPTGKTEGVFRCASGYILDALAVVKEKEVVTLHIADEGRVMYLWEDNITLLAMGLHDSHKKSTATNVRP